MTNQSCLFCIVGLCVDPDVKVHKAVGDSLELTADYSKDNLEVQWIYNETVFAEYEKAHIKIVRTQLFHKRLKINEDNISITVEDLELQDSGSFSIVAKAGLVQHKTKIIELHVHGKFNYFFILSNLLLKFQILHFKTKCMNIQVLYKGNSMLI